MRNKTRVKTAFFIGLVCAVIYLTVYIARNVLSAVSPQILSNNILLSFVYNSSPKRG